MEGLNGVRNDYIAQEKEFKDSIWYKYAIKLFETGYSLRAIERKLRAGGCSVGYSINTLKRILGENDEVVNTRVTALMVKDIEAEQERKKMKGKLGDKLKDILDKPVDKNEPATAQELRLVHDYIKDHDPDRLEVEIEEDIEISENSPNDAAMSLIKERKAKATNV